MPASEKQLKLASLMYYQIYGEELPLYEYKQQDIDFIIEQLGIKFREDKEIFQAEILH